MAGILIGNTRGRLPCLSKLFHRSHNDIDPISIDVASNSDLEENRRAPPSTIFTIYKKLRSAPESPLADSATNSREAFEASVCPSDYLKDAYDVMRWLGLTRFKVVKNTECYQIQLGGWGQQVRNYTVSST